MLTENSLVEEFKLVMNPNDLGKSMTLNHRRNISGERRLNGGVSTQQYEECFSGNTSNKKLPNFSDNRNHYRSIGWGVENARLLNYPILKERLFNSTTRKASMANQGATAA